MTELKMDCFGSVILFDLTNNYCNACPLRIECELKVKANRADIEEALARPVFDEDGKFWAAGRRKTSQKKALAKQLSTAPAIEPVVAASTPAPAVTGVRSPREALETPDLRVKVKEELEKWMARGIDPSMAASGQNPFLGMPGFRIIQAITEVALINKRSLTKKQLTAEVRSVQMAQTGTCWSDGTLNSNINIAVGAFSACGIPIIKEA